MGILRKKAILKSDYRYFISFVLIYLTTGIPKFIRDTIIISKNQYIIKGLK